MNAANQSVVQQSTTILLPSKQGPLKSSQGWHDHVHVAAVVVKGQTPIGSALYQEP